MLKNKAVAIFACMIAGFSFIALNTPTSLAIFVISLFFPVFFAVDSLLMARRMKINFELSGACVVGMNKCMHIEIARRHGLRGHIDMVFECKNRFTGAIVELPVTLCPGQRVLERFDVPLDTSCVGLISITLKKATLIDAIGLSRSPLSCAFEGSYAVYPSIPQVDTYFDRMAQTESSNVSYDQSMKGRDESEVFDLREFRRGDAMRTVHWKRTACFDELVVREASRPVDSRTVLIFGGIAGANESEEAKAELNSAASLFVGISQSLLRQGVVHTVLHKANGIIIDARPVENEGDFNTMIDEFIAFPLSSDVAFSAENEKRLSSMQQLSKIILVTNFLQNAELERLGVYGDLSVVVVGARSATAFSEKSLYRVIAVSADSVGTSVKNMEL